MNGAGVKPSLLVPLVSIKTRLEGQIGANRGGIGGNGARH
jgi:hypothetical protein